MSEVLRSILLGTIGLDVALAAALYVGVRRGGLRCSARELRSLVVLGSVAVALQAVHFGEEMATGFYERFPALLGLAAWPPGFFAGFNVVWLAIWILATAGLGRWPLARLPIWFLAIASVANGIVHPLFSLRVGGYFPGLVTSPFVGVCGLVLLGRLTRFTGRGRDGMIGATPGTGAEAGE